MPRSNSAIFVTNTDAFTGSFFGIQSDAEGAMFDEVMFVGQDKITTNIGLPTGSLVEVEFTEFKLARGKAIVYVQSTD
jgi:hypothetical protein